MVVRYYQSNAFQQWRLEVLATKVMRNVIAQLKEKDVEDVGFGWHTS